MQRCVRSLQLHACACDHHCTTSLPWSINKKAMWVNDYLVADLKCVHLQRLTAKHHLDRKYKPQLC